MADVLILGAGLAGSAAACLLARSGRQVCLLERETGPHHKVCGEFLSVEAIAHLHDLGLDPAGLGAVPIKRVRLVVSAHEVEAPLPFTALGLSRHALDEALIELAASSGAHVERGVRVLELDGHVARTSRGAREGRRVLVATGKLPLRMADRPATTPASNPFVGLKMHYRLAPDVARDLVGTIALVLFAGGYAGLQPVEGGAANLCLVLRRSVFARLGSDWQGVRTWLDASPFLRRMLTGAQPLFARPVTIANLSYGISGTSPAEDWVFRLGDRWAMTPSLTGDGMAIALRSAFLAASSLLAGNDAACFHDRLDAQTRRQLSRARIAQTVLQTAPLRAAALTLLRYSPSLLTHAAQATRLSGFTRWRGPAPG